MSQVTLPRPSVRKSHHFNHGTGQLGQVTLEFQRDLRWLSCFLRGVLHAGRALVACGYFEKRPDRARKRALRTGPMLLKNLECLWVKA